MGMKELLQPADQTQTERQAGSREEAASSLQRPDSDAIGGFLLTAQRPAMPAFVYICQKYP
jgi:hypothetical protein